jgi:SAM-dependent methyltransferase
MAGNISVSMVNGYLTWIVMMLHIGLKLANKGPASFVGIDPSEAAVAAVSAKAKVAGLKGKMKFMTGNIYELSLSEKFDCMVLRGCSASSARR